MNLTIDSVNAAALANKAIHLAQAGAELGAFGEADPEMASSCGVEICSLEARMILSGGSISRVAEISAQAARMSQPATISVGDLDTLSRLEQVVALGSSRIGLRMAALDAALAESPKASLGTVIGLATSAIGLYKAIF